MDNNTATVAQNQYGLYSVPLHLGHRPAVRKVTQGKVYEPKTIAFMARNAGQGDIIHAGTFFGDFLPGVCAGMAKGRKVWAFEPNPNSYENAKETARLNKLSCIQLHNNALSDQSGEILFRTHDEDGNPLGGHSHFVDELAPGISKVAAVALDDVVPADREVSILQLDVEGHERNALLGARRIIEAWKPILILEEFHAGRWLRNNFKGLEYQRVRRLHGNIVFATPDTEILPIALH